MGRRSASLWSYGNARVGVRAYRWKESLLKTGGIVFTTTAIDTVMNIVYPSRHKGSLCMHPEMNFRSYSGTTTRGVDGDDMRVGVVSVPAGTDFGLLKVIRTIFAGVRNGATGSKGT